MSYKYIYGPIVSKRLGRSLGVDIVPFKICNYDCLYCQLGRTKNKTNHRKEYVKITDVLQELKLKLSETTPDYISIVGSGEPTLNSRIGELIKEIKKLTSIPICVITNGSLLYLKEVQDDLLLADLVIPSLDVGDAKTFNQVNNPHSDISFDEMIAGIADFTKKFKGKLWLEVLLLKDITDVDESIKNIAKISNVIKPDKVQISTISRPPAEDNLKPVALERLIEIKSYFNGYVEVIYDTPASEADKANAAINKETILALLIRHSSPLEDIARGLAITKEEALKIIDELITENKVKKLNQLGKDFYIAINKDI